MADARDTQTESQLSETSDKDTLRRFVHTIESGQHWYPALLKAIGEWQSTEEETDEGTRVYLVGGEAFDWLLLAERITSAADGLIPEDELTSLLFTGQPPLVLEQGVFKESLGEKKYKQYLNFFYGITVEEALIKTVEEEVRKEHRSWGFYREKDTVNEAYRRIYGSTRMIMLRRFRKEQGYSQLKSIEWGQLKEFTYWLFKFRLKQSDKARVASDTKKGLDWLNSHGFNQHPEQVKPGED